MQRRAYEAALPQAAAPLPLAAGTTAIRQAGQQVGQQATAAPTPTPQAVELLRKNPALAKEFDAKYGFGSARRYLKTP
jgi:hypothetical protein